MLEYSNVNNDSKHSEEEYLIELGKRIKSIDRKSTRLNSSHVSQSRMPSSA